MKYYELTCIITADFSEEDLIANLPNPPTNKQSTANLIALEFWSEPDKIAELEKNLKDNKQIQRYLIVVKNPEKAEIKPARKPMRESKAQAEKSKVELKKIGEKLDEILKSE